MAKVSDIINQAAVDLGLMTVNETITNAIQTDAFNRINQLLDALSAEGLTVPNQVEQVFPLIGGLTAYTLGPGGTFVTTGGLRAMKVTSWRAFYQNVLHAGGRVLSIPEWAEQAKQLVGEATPIPSIVGADTSYPNINVRCFPPTRMDTPGQIELGYWTPLLNFLTVGDTITLPPGWLELLEWNLAKRMYPSYPSPARKDLIWTMAQETKQALIEQNAMTAPQPQPAAPQGQK